MLSDLSGLYDSQALDSINIVLSKILVSLINYCDVCARLTQILVL